MWQIHVVPSTGVVTVDGGDVYDDGRRYTLAPAELGTATQNSYVVWQAGDVGGLLLLETSLDQVGYSNYRVIGEVLQTDRGLWQSKQYVFGPIEARGGALLPFDVVVLANGHYGVYVPDFSENVSVNTSGESRALLCDTPPGADDMIDLGASATRALFYLQVRDSGGGDPDYYWGVVAGNSPSGAVRGVVEFEIATMSSAIHQYWHGNINVKDTAQDGASIQRRDGTYGDLSLQLKDFDAGRAHIGDVFALVDYVVRDNYGQGPVVDYVSGADLRASIGAMISAAIAEALADLLDPDSQTGAMLIAYLSNIFQPLVTTDTTSDGLASARYVGIEKTTAGVAWEPE